MSKYPRGDFAENMTASKLAEDARWNDSVSEHVTPNLCKPVTELCPADIGDLTQLLGADTLWPVSKSGAFGAVLLIPLHLLRV